jgi:hypothetical protein
MCVYEGIHAFPHVHNVFVCIITLDLTFPARKGVDMTLNQKKEIYEYYEE